MSTMSEGPPDHLDTPMTVSLIVRMGPVLRPGGAGLAAFSGDLSEHAEGLLRYFVAQLERFGEQRGADLFVALSAQRGDEIAGHEYRSGRYVKPAREDPTPSAPPEEPDVATSRRPGVAGRRA